jgi:hypothetical protein
VRPFLAPIAVAILGLAVSGCALLADTDATSLAARATAIASCMRRMAPDLAATRQAEDAASDARRAAMQVEPGMARLSRLARAHDLAQPFLASAEQLSPGVPQAWRRLSDEAAGARAFHRSRWTGMSSEVFAYVERGRAAYDAARLGYLAVSGPTEAIGLLGRWARGSAPAEVVAQGGDVVAATGLMAREAPTGHAVLRAHDRTRERMSQYMADDDKVDARFQLLELARLTQGPFSLDADTPRSVGALLVEARDDLDALERLEVATLDQVRSDREQVIASLRVVEAAARHVPECAGTGPLQAFPVPGTSPVISVGPTAPERSTRP